MHRVRRETDGGLKLTGKIIDAVGVAPFRYWPISVRMSNSVAPIGLANVKLEGESAGFSFQS